MRLRAFKYTAFWCGLFLVGALALSGCDLPTSSPDFEVDSSVRAPLLMDRTFQFLGRSTSEHEALIDTTEGEIDTLFSVDPTGENTVRISEEISNFDLGGDLNDALPDVTIDPLDVSTDVGELSDQSFDTQFDEQVGAIVVDSDVLPSGQMPMDTETNPDRVVVDQLSPLPPEGTSEGIEDMTVENITQATYGSRSNGFNRYSFTLTNNSGAELTNEAGDGPPAIELVDPVEGRLSRVEFSSTIADGASQSADLLHTSFIVDGDETYVLDVGGAGSVRSAPNGAMDLSLSVSDLSLSALTADLTRTTELDASQDDIRLGGEENFTGIEIASGSLTLTLSNSLPTDVTFSQLRIRTASQVGDQPSGTEVVDFGQVTIPAASGPDTPGTTTETASLDGQVLSRELDVDAVADITTYSQERVQGSSGVSIEVDGTVDVAQLHFVPEAETFSSSGSFSLDTEEVSFDQAGDFVELQDGTLSIANLTNEMGLALEELRISVPGVRSAPYAPGDSLVIRFEGASDDPGNYTFRAVDANSTRSEPAEVALDGMRLYPTDNELAYHVTGVSEDATGQADSTRTIGGDDQITAQVETSALTVDRVEATLEPTEVAISEDANGDGDLALDDDAEANVVDVEGLADIGDRVDGIEIIGTQLALNLTTNLTSDAMVYAAIVGRGGEERVFLKGRNESTVAASDPLSQGFRNMGASIAASNLIRFRVPGSDDPSTATTRTVVLDGSNSNVDEFLSALPSEVRIVAQAEVNPDGDRVVVQRPIQDLEASLSVTMPLHIGGGSFTARDTVEADFSDLEDLTNPEEDVVLKSGSVHVTYSNGLPVGAELRLTALDDQYEPVGVRFGTGQSPISLDPGQKDANGFVTGSVDGEASLELSESEARTLADGRHVLIELTVLTGSDAGARFRATDAIVLGARGEFTLRVRQQ